MDSTRRASGSWQAERTSIRSCHGHVSASGRSGCGCTPSSMLGSIPSTGSTTRGSSQRCTTRASARSRSGQTKTQPYNITRHRESHLADVSGGFHFKNYACVKCQRASLTFNFNGQKNVIFFSFSSFRFFYDCQRAELLGRDIFCHCKRKFLDECKRRERKRETPLTN